MLLDEHSFIHALCSSFNHHTSPTTSIFLPRHPLLACFCLLAGIGDETDPVHTELGVARIRCYTIPLLTRELMERFSFFFFLKKKGMPISMYNKCYLLCRENSFPLPPSLIVSSRVVIHHLHSLPPHNLSPLPYSPNTNPLPTLLPPSLQPIIPRTIFPLLLKNETHSRL